MFAEEYMATAQGALAKATMVRKIHWDTFCFPVWPVHI